MIKIRSANGGVGPLLVTEVKRAMGLLALWLQTLEEVGRGTPWEKAWAFMPIDDPCAQHELGTLSLAQYDMANAYHKGVAEVMAWRTNQ